MTHGESTARLTDEVVIVTGGANGIGRAIAELALRDGARVVAVDVDEPAIAELQRDASSGRFIGRVADVTAEEQVADVVAEVNGRWGGASILVNCAGRNASFELTEMSSAQWDDFFALDLKAAWLCAKHVAPAMKRRGRGSIVNIASVHAHMTAEGYFPYAAAKSGLLGLTRSMALDLGPHGVRVNSVSPGYTATRLVDEYMAANGGEPLRAEIAEKHPLRRIGSPEEIAEVVLFLASNAASFVTGADWTVDGGISARFA